MSTEGHQHSLYSWALSPSWFCGRQSRFRLSLPSADPRRQWKIHTVRAAAPGSTNRENDEAYRQFQSMLGGGSSPNPRASDSKSDAYADFADKLGLDHTSAEEIGTKNVGTQNAVTKLSSKKVEIDPADYNIFDEMLERTGGKGRKSFKGAKRYKSYLPNSKRKGAGRNNVKEEAVESGANASADNVEENTLISQTSRSLTPEEKAQAYAIMMEEFGPGVHDDVETWTADEEVDDLKPQSAHLQEPLERLSVSNPTEAAPGHDLALLGDTGAHGDTASEANKLTLKPKPSMPFHDDQSSVKRTAEYELSQSGPEATDVSASELRSALGRSLESGPIPQLTEKHGHAQNDQKMATHDTFTDEVEARLYPPPMTTSKVRDDETHSPVKEPQTVKHVSSAREDSAESSTTLLPKPKNQLDPLAGSTTSDPLRFDKSVSRSPPPQKPVFRNRKWKGDEPVKVLQDPKLVVQMDE